MQSGDLGLWNPRLEPGTAHFLVLADATLHPLTSTGRLTIDRLRLNRPALVAYRRRQWVPIEERLLLEQYGKIVAALENLQSQHALLLEEHRAWLEGQRTLLKWLLPREN